MKHHLLLIHGFPHDHTVWDLQVSGLREEADLIVPDLRGFGVGKKEYVPDVMGMETYAADLKELLDERGIDRAVICGLSMGGYVAMAFMELFPDRVKALILCNTKASADDDEAKQGRYKVAEQAFDPGVPVIARAMIPKMLSEKTRKEREPIARTIEMMMARQPEKAVAAAAQGMAIRPDRRKWLENIRVPTLIISGSKDELMDASTAKELQKGITGSDLEVIDGASHLSNIDSPDQFNEVVIRFLSGLEDHDRTNK